MQHDDMSVLTVRHHPQEICNYAGFLIQPSALNLFSQVGAHTHKAFSRSSAINMARANTLQTKVSAFGARQAHPEVATPTALRCGKRRPECQ